MYQLNQNRLLAYTDEPLSVKTVCNIADIAILAVPAKDAVCETSTPYIITKQELALKGALEVRLSKNWLEKKVTPIFNSQPATSQISSLKMVTSQISGIEKYEADMITEQNGTSGKVLAPTILPPKPASTEKTAGEHIGDLKYAVGTPQRPWQLYRRYSKAARGLPDS